MTTLRQIEANRKNSEKSTGPTSSSGKSKSRRNAVKHGLACLTLLPAEFEAIVAERIVELSATFPPSCTLDQWYLERAAVESVRVEQATFQAHELVLEQVLRADECWDEDRLLDAARLLDRLPKNPEVIVRELLRTKQGCELVIERWESLRCVLEQTKQPWNEVQRGFALDLLGVGAEFRATRYATVTTVEAQDQLASARIALLKRHQTNHLEVADDRHRDRARRGLAHPDREICLIRRYELSSQRRFDQAMRYLKSNKPKKGKPAKAEPKQTPTVIEPTPEPAPAPFRITEKPIESKTLEPIVAEPIQSEPEPDPIREPVVKDVDALIERAKSIPIPVVKPKGNREYRRAMARREREKEKARMKAR